MEIVTGVGEKPHVTSKKFRRIIESITGQGSYIIGCGDNMSTELVSNNLLKIKSGAMIHHGNVSSVDPYDEIEINNGTQGMKRIDLVVNRYTKNAETEIEKNEWIVIQGAPAASNPAVPEHVVGNLQEGDLVDDCPFCQIYIDGINVTEVKELLTIIPNVPDLVAENAARKKEVAELNSNKLDSVGLKSKEIPFGDKTNFYMRLASKEPWHKAFALVMGYDNIHGVIFEVVNAWVLADGTTIKFLTKSLSSKSYTWVEDNTSNWNVHVTGFQTSAKVFVLYSGFSNIGVY